MSSRALRKLHGKEELNPSKSSPADNSDVEDGGPADLIGSAKKKKNFNYFDLLNEGDADSNEDGSQNDQSEENNEPEAPAPKLHESHEANQKKKRKKKKKAKKGPQNACSSEDNVEEGDDFERLIQEVDEIMGQSKSSTKSQQQSVVPMSRSNLLSIEHRHLNPNNELKKIFGFRTVQAEQRAQRGRGKRTLRSTWLTTPKDDWPQIGKQGLSMQMIDSDPKSPTFAFVHSQAYKAVEEQYVQAVATSIPENIVAIINAHPYHVNGNLASSDLCRIHEDLALAADLVERALYALEHAFHPSFNIATGTCRLAYRHQVNRPLFVALLKHALYVGGRACYRTSLELWKLLLSLDPEDDPLAVVLAIDFYAIRSSQYEWLIQFCSELESRRNLSQLPNMAYSLAIAKFLLSKKLASKGASAHEQKEKLAEEADKLLRDALIMFPSALPMILDKCSIQAPQHNYFTTDALKSQSPALEQLMKLYVYRGYHVWKEPDLLPWLERIVKEVVEMVEKKDPAIDDAAQKRSRRYRGALPRSILRHIILCDMKDVPLNAMPANERGTIMALDPLPPTDSIDLYSLPRFRRPASSVRYALRLIQSLFPSFDINQVVAENENAAVAEANNAPVVADAQDAQDAPDGEANNDNTFVNMANNLRQSIRALFLLTGAGGDNPDGEELPDSELSDYEDEVDDDEFDNVYAPNMVLIDPSLDWLRERAERNVDDADNDNDADHVGVAEDGTSPAVAGNAPDTTISDGANSSNQSIRTSNTPRETGGDNQEGRQSDNVDL